MLLSYPYPFFLTILYKQLDCKGLLNNSFVIVLLDIYYVFFAIDLNQCRKSADMYNTKNFDLPGIFTNCIGTEKIYKYSTGFNNYVDRIS